MLEEKVTKFPGISFSNCPLLLQSHFIQLHTRECLYNLQLKQILYCTSDNYLTTIYLEQEKKVMISRPLKYFEELLGAYGFTRVHNKFLVNLTHIESCCHSEDGYIIRLSSGMEIGASRNMRKNLAGALSKISVDHRIQNSGKNIQVSG